MDTDNWTAKESPMRLLSTLVLILVLTTAACEREPAVSLTLEEAQAELDAYAERQALLAARAPAWTGECPAAFLDPPSVESDADLERETLVHFAVMSAVERGDAAAIRCALARAAGDVANGLENGYPESVLMDSAQRLYQHAYLGELLGLGTAADGRPACALLSRERRETQRYFARLTVESAVEAGDLERRLLAAARTGESGGDYCPG